MSNAVNQYECDAKYSVDMTFDLDKTRRGQEGINVNVLDFQWHVVTRIQKPTHEKTDTQIGENVYKYHFTVDDTSTGGNLMASLDGSVCSFGGIRDTVNQLLQGDQARWDDFEVLGHEIRPKISNTNTCIVKIYLSKGGVPVKVGGDGNIWEFWNAILCKMVRVHCSTTAPHLRAEYITGQAMSVAIIDESQAHKYTLFDKEKIKTTVEDSKSDDPNPFFTNEQMGDFVASIKDTERHPWPSTDSTTGVKTFYVRIENDTVFAIPTSVRIRGVDLTKSRYIVREDDSTLTGFAIMTQDDLILSGHLSVEMKRDVHGANSIIEDIGSEHDAQTERVADAALALKWPGYSSLTHPKLVASVAYATQEMTATFEGKGGFDTDVYAMTTKLDEVRALQAALVDARAGDNTNRQVYEKSVSDAFGNVKTSTAALIAMEDILYVTAEEIRVKVQKARIVANAVVGAIIDLNTVSDDDAMNRAANMIDDAVRNTDLDII